MTAKEKKMLDTIEETCRRIGVQIAVTPEGECLMRGNTKAVSQRFKDMLTDAKPLILAKHGHKPSVFVAEPPTPESRKDIPTNVCLAFTEGYWPRGHDNRLKPCPKCGAKYCESCQFRFDYKCPKCEVTIH